MLKVTMTHLKEGYLRKNGLARSDKAIVTEYYVRHHQYLIVARIVDDPVYLTEPFIRSYNWVLNENMHLAPNYCIPSELVSRPKGWVPHHLPGTNQYLTDVYKRQSRRRALARLRRGFDLDWTPPRSRDELHER